MKANYDKYLAEWPSRAAKYGLKVVKLTMTDTVDHDGDPVVSAFFTMDNSTELIEPVFQAIRAFKSDIYTELFEEFPDKNLHSRFVREEELDWSYYDDWNPEETAYEPSEAK